jgi:HAMP domain-containing protein
MAQTQKIRFGLLPKLLLGVLTPIFIVFFILGSMIFYSWSFGPFRVNSIKTLGSESLKELSVTSFKESTESLNRLGEKIIQEKARDVAAQIEIYLGSHPKLKREDLSKDPWLKTIAVQKVGETGYTAVHDTQGFNYFHANPKIVGMNLQQLSTKFPAFWKILEASLKGPASGYYDWQDEDGKIRPKYMYLAHVQGSNLVVAATTYIDEFSVPSRVMEKKMKEIENQYLRAYETKFKAFYVATLLVFAFLLLVIFFYSRSVVQPILSLSEVANKISMGDLNAQVRVKGRGEIGVLAESIERMQISVKAAIERLQRKREAR